MQLRPSPTLLSMFLAALVALLFCGPAYSVEEPLEVPVYAQWKKLRYRTTTNNTRLSTVLNKFAKAEGLHLSITKGVNGRVTGTFDLPPEKLLDTLATQHNFTWRLTGRKLVISPATSTNAALKIVNDPFGNNLTLRSSRTTSPLSSSAPLAAVPLDPALAPLKVWSTTPADKTLQNALARWAIVAGWQLFWELPQDFSVEAAASINGSFEDAVTAVANSLQQTDVPVSAIFFEGNRVLRIVAKGAQ